MCERCWHVYNKFPCLSLSSQGWFKIVTSHYLDMENTHELPLFSLTPLWKSKVKFNLEIKSNHHRSRVLCGIHSSISLVEVCRYRKRRRWMRVVLSLVRILCECKKWKYLMRLFQAQNFLTKYARDVTE